MDKLPKMGFAISETFSSYCVLFLYLNLSILLSQGLLISCLYSEWESLPNPPCGPEEASKEHVWIECEERVEEEHA